MDPRSTTAEPFDAGQDESEVTLLDMAIALAEHWKLVIALPLLCGLAAWAATHLMQPIFTARVSFLPPQQQSSAAATALSSLGAISGLAGAAAGLRTPADQYAALLQSENVENRIITEFKLREAYEFDLLFDTRREFRKRVRVAVGKKDGLISVEVDDESPQRAAAMCNRMVDELRRLTSELALTEAQQRRVFFENQLKSTRESLNAAQTALQSSGFNAGALRAEPRAAAEGYAKLKAEMTSTEVQLQALRSSLTDASPEVQRLLTTLSALRTQLSRLETVVPSNVGADYVSKFREFKYQETLFELFSRQFELARLDESKEGTLIQVVDAATPAEKKTRPRRAIIAAVTSLAAGLLLITGIMLRRSWRLSANNSATALKMDQLRAAFNKR